jgi:hypothetical protein
MICGMRYGCDVVVGRKVPVLYLSQENNSSPLKKYILYLKEIKNNVDFIGIL